MKRFTRGSSKSWLHLAVVGLVLAVGLGMQRNPAPTQAAGRKLEVLFLGHVSRLHPSDSAAAYLVPALAKEGINFSYSTDPNDLNAANLAKYDALLVYANHDSITPAQEKALVDFVEA